MVCLSRPYPCNFLKAVFHKFYLVYSWILCPICFNLSEIKKQQNKFQPVCLKVDLKYITINSVDSVIYLENSFLPLSKLSKKTPKQWQVNDNFK